MSHFEWLSNTSKEKREQHFFHAQLSSPLSVFAEAQGILQPHSNRSCRTRSSFNIFLSLSLPQGTMLSPLYLRAQRSFPVVPVPCLWHWYFTLDVCFGGGKQSDGAFFWFHYHLLIGVSAVSCIFTVLMSPGHQCIPTRCMQLLHHGEQSWLQIYLCLSFLFFSPSLHFPWNSGINFAALCVGAVRFGLNTIILIPLANLFFPIACEVRASIVVCHQKDCHNSFGRAVRSQRFVSQVGFSPWASGRHRVVAGWAEGVAEQMALYCRLSDVRWPANKVRQDPVLWDPRAGMPPKCHLPLPHCSHLQQRRWHSLTVLH